MKAQNSPQLDEPPRERAEAALDKALNALVELLAVAELVDEKEPLGARALRQYAGLPEARHASAKRQARQTIQDIWTLRGKPGRRQADTLACGSGRAG